MEKLELEPTEQDLHKLWVKQHYEELLKGIKTGKITAEEGVKTLTDERFRLEDRADRDGLLEDFYNQKGFTRQLEGQITLAKEYPELVGTLLTLDVDQFKRFNDTYGHPEGDELLKTYAQVIKEQTDRADIWGRLGGDELAVYLIKCDIAQAMEVAQRIRQETVIAIKEKFSNLSWKQTISIGITQLEEDDTSKSLRVRADEALYDAKKGETDQEKIKIHQSDI